MCKITSGEVLVWAKRFEVQLAQEAMLESLKDVKEIDAIRKQGRKLYRKMQ